MGVYCPLCLHNTQEIVIVNLFDLICKVNFQSRVNFPPVLPQTPRDQFNPSWYPDNLDADPNVRLKGIVVWVSRK
jgi:hypothetical protein